MSQFCKDCKHVVRALGHSKSHCDAVSSISFNAVTGKKKVHRVSCSSRRGSQGFDCADFAPKPTTWERIKEVFNVN